MCGPGYLQRASEGRSKSYGIRYFITPHGLNRSHCRIGNRGPPHCIIRTPLLVVKAVWTLGGDFTVGTEEPTRNSSFAAWSDVRSWYIYTTFSPYLPAVEPSIYDNRL